MTRPPVHPSYFVWYRLAGEPGPARSAVAAMMAEIAAGTGVRGRLMRRADDPTTWMEIYESTSMPAEFDAMLSMAAARHGVDRCARDGRHVERFVAADVPVDG